MAKGGKGVSRRTNKGGKQAPMPGVGTGKVPAPLKIGKQGKSSQTRRP